MPQQQQQQQQQRRQQWSRQHDGQDIKACQSWFEVQDIYQRRSAQMDHVKLTAVLSALAKMAPSGAAPTEEAHSYHALVCDVLTDIATTHIARLGGREISTALWAAAKACVSPDCWDAWLPQLLTAASSQLPRGFNPQDLSMLLWALATMQESTETAAPMHGGWDAKWPAHTRSAPGGQRAQPSLPDRLLHDVLVAAAAQLHAFSAQALSNSLWALAKLGYRPTDAWLHAALQRMEATMPEFTNQALCNVAWALVVLEHQPSTSWRHSFLHHSSQALEFAEPKVLAQLVWSSARLKLSPGHAWLERCACRAVAFQWQRPPSFRESFGAGAQRPRPSRQQAGSPQDLSNVLWALAAQQFRPSAGDMRGLVQACMQCLQGFEPNELCSVIWALAKLGYQPPAEQTHQLLAAVTRAVSKCSAQGLCNVVWAVATLRLAPGQQWMQEILSNLVLKLDGCGPQELANLWWALGSMRWRLGPALREELAGELRVNLHEFNPGETGMILWALARLELQPEPEVLLRQLQLICAHRDSRGASFSASFSASALSSASGAPGPGSAAPSLQPRTVTAVLWALSAMEQTVASEARGRGGLLGPSHREVLDELLLKSLPWQVQEGQGEPGLALPWSPRELALCMYSLGSMQVVPPKPWLLAAALQCARLAPASTAGAAERFRLVRGRSGSRLVVARRTGPGSPAGAAAAAVLPAAAQPGAAAATGVRRSMSARDAAMIGHGLAGILRQMQSVGDRPSLRRRLALVGGLGVSRGGWNLASTAVSVSPSGVRVARARALAERLRSMCVRQLIGCFALSVEQAHDNELVMLVSALPQLTGCLGQRKQLRWTGIQRQRLRVAGVPAPRPGRAAGAGAAQPRGLMRSCMAGVHGLLSAARVRMERGGMSTRQVACVASAAARMAVHVDVRFARAVMARCSDGPAASGSGLGDGDGLLVGPTCRDWVVCLWALERLQAHHALLRGLEARSWVAKAAGNIVRLLSRPGRPIPSLARGAERPQVAAAASNASSAAPAAASAASEAQPSGGEQRMHTGAAGAASAMTLTLHARSAVARPRAVPGKARRQELWRQQQEQRRQQRRLRRGMPGLGGRERRVLRQRHLATYFELQAAAAAAARLARSAREAAAAAATPTQSPRKGNAGTNKGLAASAAASSSTLRCAPGLRVHGGPTAAVKQPVPGSSAGVTSAAAEELSSLALQLQHASGLLRQVHWRRVHIGRASEPKQVQQGRGVRPSHVLN